MRAYLCTLNGTAGIIVTGAKRRNHNRLKHDFIRSTYAKKRFAPDEIKKIAKDCVVREVEINERGFVAFQVGVKETCIKPL